MKNCKVFFLVFLASILLLSGCTMTTKKTEENETSSQVEQQKLMTAIENNKDYNFQVAKKLTTFKSNTDSGYRTAGSQAEFDAGEYLKEEMMNMGLSNVHKDSFTTDSWEYRKGLIQFVDESGQLTTEQLGGQAVQYFADQQQFQLIDGGRATASDLENLNVKGKWVLAEIDQASDWWVNYPAMQASLKGAEGVIAVNVSGYGEASEETIVTQDMCGPETTPIFTISQKTANALKKVMEKNNLKEMTITLSIDSEVTPDQTSYNIIGEIPGKSDEMIVLAAHYDAYWDGFQDDGTAIGMSFSIAKALIDSGYKPEKTIMLIAHGAEEWGTINTRYDWAVGSHKQITENTPEWSKKIATLINFESPAMKQFNYALVRTCYEYNTVLTELLASIDNVPSDFTEGLKTEYPLRSWSDDFAYQTAGVPAFRNGYSDPNYDSSIYHTPLDNETTYHLEDTLFQQKMYGLLLMAFDQFTVLPMDFSLRLSEMKKSLEDSNVYESAQISYTQLESAIDDANREAINLYERIKKAQGQSTTMNPALLEAFAFAEDHFTKLTWEDVVIFPHQHGYSNVTLLQEAIDALNEQDGTKALDEVLYHIDNNWYAYDFDKETVNYFTQQVLGQSADRLNWGEGKIVGHCDLVDVISSLQQKVNDKNVNYTSEITQLQQALEVEKASFHQVVTQQIQDLNQFTSMLKAIQ